MDIDDHEHVRPASWLEKKTSSDHVNEKISTSNNAFGFFVSFNPYRHEEDGRILIIPRNKREQRLQELGLDRSEVINYQDTGLFQFEKQESTTIINKPPPLHLKAFIRYQNKFVEQANYFQSIVKL